MCNNEGMSWVRDGSRFFGHTQYTYEIFNLNTSTSRIDENGSRVTCKAGSSIQPSETSHSANAKF